jgi:competence protein ComEA
MECIFMKNFISALSLVSIIFSAPVLAVDSKAPVSSPPTAPAVAKPTAGAQQDVININTADAQTLAKLNGIGPKKAEAIIAWRKANGAFKTVDQLADVKGIGAKTLDANRKMIRI